MENTRQRKEKLVICGAGETALLAFEYFAKDSNYEVCGFAVDRNFLSNDRIHGLPVVDIETVKDIFPTSACEAFVAVSSRHLNRDRAKLFHKVKEMGYSLATYVSSRAFVWDNVAIGSNCFVLENNVLQPFTEIGNNVTLWSGNHIGHRTIIRDHVFLSSHCVVSGFCEIGEFSFLGVNCAMADSVKIASDNFISMGAVVSKSTEEDGLYKGNPAEKHKLSAKRFCKVR